MISLQVMRKCRQTLPILITCAFAILPASPSLSGEPAYGHKSLSNWLAIYRNAGPDSGEEKRAEAAVRAIGTNAFPFLIETLTNNDPSSQSAALNGFHILGPLAAPSLPILAEFLTGTNALLAHLASSSLGHIGSPALPVLMAGLTNRHYRVSTDATLALAELGTNARPAIPLLLHDLQQPNHFIRERAADALGNLHIESQLVVPALTNLLEDPSPSARYLALASLGRFEAEARSALPAIYLLLDDQDEVIRNAATNAVRQIAPEALNSPGH